VHALWLQASVWAVEERTRERPSWLHAPPHSLSAPHDQQHTDNVHQQRFPVALGVQAVECQLSQQFFSSLLAPRVRLVAEGRPCRLLIATERHTFLLFKVNLHRRVHPSLFGIHRKTAAFSLARIDTKKRCPDLPQQRIVSVGQSPALLVSGSSVIHW
jgi:hypothetical protein